MHETTHTNPFEGFLAVASDLAVTHINSRVVEDATRREVEKAIVELSGLGCPIDDISEATGWTPGDIRLTLERMQGDADLAQLAGIS
jgi:hypothetical protein